MSEPWPIRLRQTGVRALAPGLIGLLLLVACAAPSPTPTLQATLRPLPEDLSGVPQPGFSTTLQPHSEPGTVPPGAEVGIHLGHCGLSSPIDLDGSLWDPIAGDDGQGGPLTGGQRGELINATLVTLMMLEPDRAQLQTPLGALITLVRHHGARAYNICN